MEPIKFGLIGCGAFGRFCLEAYSSIEGLKIVAVADVRKAAAEALADEFGVDACYDAASIIARDDIRLLHLATPPSSHYENVLACAAAGKNCLCEKPLAMNTAQADEMLAAVKAKNLIAPVNFVLRYNDVTTAVKAILDSGVLGKVLSARLTNCASDSQLFPDHWFWDKKISGGIFIEHGVHFFDLYRYWLGPGKVISAHTETREGTPQEDRVMCMVRHENGAVASHYHGFDQAGPMDRTDHRLVCELGDIRVDGWIPLTLRLDAALNDAGTAMLLKLLPGARMDLLENIPQERKDLRGRGRERSITRRVAFTWTPQEDKQTAYRQSVIDLMRDQMSYLRDSRFNRRVTEENGRSAVAMAEAAVRLANKGH